MRAEDGRKQRKNKSQTKIMEGDTGRKSEKEEREEKRKEGKLTYFFFNVNR